MNKIEEVFNKIVNDKDLHLDEFIKAFKDEKGGNEDDAKKDLISRITNISDKDTKDKLINDAKNKIGNIDNLKGKLSDLGKGLFN